MDITDSSRGDVLLGQAEALTDIDMTDYTVVTNVPGDLDSAAWVIPPDGALPTVTQSSSGALNFSAPSIAPTQAGSGAPAPAESVVAAFTTTEEDPPVDPPVDPPADVDGDAGETTGDPDPATGWNGCPPHVQCSPPRVTPRKSIAWQTPNCYARYDQTIAWFDHCSQWGSVSNDGDSLRNHWLYKQYGTCKSRPGVVLRECRLSSERLSSGPALSWEDWGPRADKTTSSCSSVDISVSAYGVSVGGSFTGCEVIDITKYADGGHFKVAWNYGGQRVVNSERATQYQIAFGTPNLTPKLLTSWGLTAYVLPG